MSLKEDFSEFLRKHNISQNAAGTAMGYSGAVVSQWLSGTYKGDLDRVEDTARIWMEREKNRRSAQTLSIVETDTLRRITNAIRIVHEERDIGVITGPAGIGKTTAMKRYCQQNPGSGVYIEVDASMNKTATMQALADALGLDSNGEFTSLVKRSIKALSERDVVVFIDQADYLSDGTLELLRQVVHDKGQSGLVLAGLERLEFRLKNVRNDHHQLLSRIGVLARVEGLKEADAEKILQSVWPTLDKDTIKAFYKVSGPSARVLSKLIDRAARTTIINNKQQPDTDTVVVAGSLILR